MTVICEPINVINNIPLRHTRKVTLRPITDSGKHLFKLWIKERKWDHIKEASSIDTKVNILHNELINKVKDVFPEKTLKITSDDSPWCNDRVKKLKRLKSREFNKHRSSQKWNNLNETYKACLSQAKLKYYKNIVQDLKTSNPSQWYSKLKRICSYEQERYAPLICSEIENLSDQEQAERIANHFCKVREKFDPLKIEDINIPHYEENSIPQFSVTEVKIKLSAINPKKSVPIEDIPPQILKTFAAEISEPLTDIINSSIRQGVWPDMWKTEYVTPIPKVYPPKLIKNLRSISGLTSFNKVAEKLISEIILSDMEGKMDPTIYANQYGLSIQYYFVKTIHKILSDRDRGTAAVLATFCRLEGRIP